MFNFGCVFLNFGQSNMNFDRSYTILPVSSFVLYSTSVVSLSLRLTELVTVPVVHYYFLSSGLLIIHFEFKHYFDASTIFICIITLNMTCGEFQISF